MHTLLPPLRALTPHMSMAFSPRVFGLLALSLIHQAQVTVSQQKSASPTHPPVNASQTPATPSHTALDNKANITVKQSADVSNMSPLQSHPPLTVKAAIVSSQDINTCETIGQCQCLHHLTQTISLQLPMAGYLPTVSGHFKDRALARVHCMGQQPWLSLAT